MGPTLAGRVSVRAVGTEAEAPTAMVTVKVTKTDWTVVSRSMKVGFYKRMPQLGDFIYPEGDISDVYDSGRTVIAIVCYINPDDRAHGMGVHPRAIYGPCAWGAEVDLTMSSASNAGLSTSDVMQIPNVSFTDSDPAANNFVDDSEPDGVRRLPSSGQLRGGFVKTPVAFGEFDEGDIIPLGMLETHYIIQHRNRILNDDGIKLDPPVANPSVPETETEALTRLLNAANKTPGNGYRYYFPAASYAFAYEPKVNADEMLDKAFKANNWFLPAPGDVQSLIYFANRARDPRFDKAKASGVLDLAGYGHTTGEYGAACYKPDMSSGVPLYVYNDSYSKKNPNASVYPMVAF